ncbi:MAG: hypothetical protein LQ342_007523 [Letrouitia transgressa]|nr:MAG: hypothetical protein LQ342_007523 [Letrouitia transgressa]
MANPTEPTIVQPSSLGFSVSFQKIDLDIDLLNRSLKGKAEVTINPHSRDLKSIRLSCRQCAIQRVTANGRACSNISYEDPYLRKKLSWKASAHQHHMLRRQVQGQLKTPPEEELVINLPKSVKIDEIDPSTVEAQSASITKLSFGSKKDSVDDTPVESVQARSAVEQERRFTPITLVLEYVIHSIRDGMQFVGWQEGELRYPHAYTRNSSFPGSACCLFPCIDDSAARCSWEISIKCPKTIGDALASKRQARMTRSSAVLDRDPVFTTTEVDQSDFSDADKALDIAVICTGDMTDEIDDPVDTTKRTSSFSCGNLISAQHIGFAIGPFEHVDLAEFRDDEEDDKLGQNAVPLHSFCLPGRAEEVRNTCLPMAKAIDFFTIEYGSYPFPNYKMCFIDDCYPGIIHTGCLTICNSNLLFPEDVIEPLERVSRQLIHALAFQWMGIHVIPKETADTWVVVGIAYFMTDAFMRKLFGKNDYGFRQKIASDRVTELDVARPSLHETGALIELDTSELEFMELKAPLVLSILDRRLTKAGSSSGLSRIISRVFLNAKVGDLPNGAVTTAVFAKTCEKLGHAKLETFFAQWVYGAGCPRFRVAQKFNKKRNMVEMLITQIQVEPPDRDLEKEHFMRDVKEEMHNVYAGPVQPVFTGPMTICIHEADGSPYDHMIDIKEQVTKVDIPYNTKYKRLKRSRRQKERMAAASGLDYNPDGNDDVLLYCLGDVLQSEEEMQEWRLADWGKDQEDQMNQESYEWIRMDANFEWICKMSIGMPGYMYLSQLQQDKEVIAQLESIQYMAAQREHALISTILVRTLMDTRYFHGIRTAAAAALAKHGKDELDWLGLYHLEKAFTELFCYRDSPMTRPNDFSDRAAYYIQCAIPKAISKIRDNSGKAPMRVRTFLLDKLKYNDNSTNEYSDNHYIATLMEALADAVASKPAPSAELEEDIIVFNDEDDGDHLHFHNACIDQLDRYRRIDEWLPSYHNILSTAALNCRRKLVMARAIDDNAASFVDYTRDGTADLVRLAAFDNLLEMGLAKKEVVLKWFLFSMGTDPSPYFRQHMLRLLGKMLGSIAIGVETDSTTTAMEQDGLIIEEEGSTEARQADLARKQTVPGALAALKQEVSGNEVLKEGIWEAVRSPAPSLMEMKELLDICALLYEPKTQIYLRLKYPRYWRCTKIGPAKLRFYPTERFRTKPRPKPVVGAPLPNPVAGSSPASAAMSNTTSMAPPRRPIFKPPRRPSQGSVGSAGDVEMRNSSPAEEKPRLKIKLKVGGIKMEGGGK